MRILASYIFCAFVFIQANAQSNYRFKNLTINDGLSQSSVLTIVQDELNALWIGTQDGLNRYDGKTFEIFTSDKTEGLHSEHILCSLKDKKGDLWFGTSNGLTHYNLRSEKFQTHKPKEGVALYIQDIVEDNQGRIWMATAENSVMLYSPKTKKFISKASYSTSKKTNRITIVNNQKLVVSTDDGRLFVTDLKTEKTEEVLFTEKYGSGLRINNIINKDDNAVVVATNRGGHILDVNTLNYEPYFEELNRVAGFQSISDAYYEPSVGWFISTTNNGLYILDEEKGVEHCVEDIFQKTALLFNELNMIYRDASGTFWIGSKRGASCFNPLRKGFLGVGPSGISSRGIPTSSVWCFAENEDGHYLYVGTDRAVSRYDKRIGTFKQYMRASQTSYGTGETSVLALQVVDTSKILVGCADGFFELLVNNGRYEYKRINIKGKHDRIYGFVHWKNSLYWLATKGGAILYNESTGNIRYYEHSSISPEQTISKGICRRVYKDKNGRVWFATSTGGLNSLSEQDGEPTIRPYEHNYILKNTSTDYITSIYHEKQGVYWLGTSGSGLLRWDERSKSVNVYNKVNGLPNDVVYGILPGKPGELWLSTNKGLCRINTQRAQAKTYTEIDGLMSNEFNLGASFESETGVLYFGGIYGYNYFDPKELVDTKGEISVVFSRFKLENEWLTPYSKDSPLKKPIFETNEINLGYKQRNGARAE